MASNADQLSVPAEGSASSQGIYLDLQTKKSTKFLNSTPGPLFGYYHPIAFP